jgi:peptide/nickel transport system substrate-binding protein
MYQIPFSKSARRFALIATCLIILVGCRPTPSESTTPVDSAAQAAPTSPAQGQEKVVTFAIAEDPPSFNPLVADTGYDTLVSRLVMMGMTTIDPQGQVIPRLAAELPTLENGGVVVDETTGTMDVTWKMRPDVSWADGEKVTADDVIFTYDAITNPDTGSWMQGLDYIDSVEKVDDTTFIVHYSSIYPGYLTQFGGEQVMIWPKHYCDAAQGFVSWDCGRKPLSNGPFLLEEWVAGDHLTFVRNPNYFEPAKPLIDKVIVRIVPEETVRKTMITKGDVDVLMWATESVTHDLEGVPNVKVSISPTSRWVMRLFMNLAARGSTDPVADPHPIFSDVQVRRAIQQAIDVDVISQQIFHGYGKPVWTEFFRAPYICDIPRPEYNPDAAAKLLEDAGWTDSNGDGVRECNGCASAEPGYPMKVELITYKEYGEPLELTQQLIAEMLGKIGIQAQLTVVEGSVLWADYQSGGIEQRGDFDIDLYDDGYPGIDPTDFIWQYYHTDSATPDQGWNVGRWMNPDFDALLGEAYTLDESARKDAFCQMAQMLNDQLPQVLLFSTINADAYRDRIQGVQSNVNDIVTWNVADWKISP